MLHSYIELPRKSLHAIAMPSESPIDLLIPCPNIATLYTHMGEFCRNKAGVHLCASVALQEEGPGYWKLILQDTSGHICARISDHVPASILDNLVEIHARLIKGFPLEGSLLWLDILSLRSLQNKASYQLMCNEWTLYQMYRSKKQPKNQ